MEKSFPSNIHQSIKEILSNPLTERISDGLKTPSPIEGTGFLGSFSFTYKPFSLMDEKICINVAQTSNTEVLEKHLKMLKLGDLTLHGTFTPFDPQFEEPFNMRVYLKEGVFQSCDNPVVSFISLRKGYLSVDHEKWKEELKTIINEKINEHMQEYLSCLKENILYAIVAQMDLLLELQGDFSLNTEQIPSIF